MLQQVICQLVKGEGREVWKPCYWR